MEDPVVACAGGRISCLSVCLETAQSVRKWWENLSCRSKDGPRKRFNVVSGAIINMGGPGHLGGLYVDRVFWCGWIPHIPPTPCCDRKGKVEEPNCEQWAVMFGSSSHVIRSWWYITVPALGCRSLSWVLAMSWKANPTHTYTIVSPSPVSGKLRRIPTV